MKKCISLKKKNIMIGPEKECWFIVKGNTLKHNDLALQGPRFNEIFTSNTWQKE